MNKKNIVSDPVYHAILGRSVKLSTMKTDYDNAKIIQFDQYTLIIEVEGDHYLLSKSAIIDIEIPKDITANLLTKLDNSLKKITLKKDRSNNASVNIITKRSRVYNKN